MPKGKRSTAKKPEKVRREIKQIPWRTKAWRSIKDFPGTVWDAVVRLRGRKFETAGEILERERDKFDAMQQNFHARFMQGSYSAGAVTDFLQRLRKNYMPLYTNAASRTMELPSSLRSAFEKCLPDTKHFKVVERKAEGNKGAYTLQQLSAIRREIAFVLVSLSAKYGNKEALEVIKLIYEKEPELAIKEILQIAMIQWKKADKPQVTEAELRAYQESLRPKEGAKRLIAIPPAKAEPLGKAEKQPEKKK